MAAKATKACRCGVTIAADWPECATCLSNGVVDDNAMARRIRILEAKRRLGTQKAMEAVLKGSPGTKAKEQRAFLQQRASKRKAWQAQASAAMKEWYSEAE